MVFFQIHSQCLMLCRCVLASGIQLQSLCHLHRANSTHQEAGCMVFMDGQKRMGVKILL